MPSLVGNTLTTLQEDFSRLNIPLPNYLQESDKRQSAVNGVKQKLSELKEAKLPKGEKFQKSASGKAIAKKKALRQQRPLVSGLERVNKMIESVESLVGQINDRPRQESVRTFAHISLVGDKLCRAFNLFSESAGDKNLAKISKGLGLMSEDAALATKNLSEGDKPAHYSEQFNENMEFLISSLKLFNEITESINEVPSDSHESDEEGKKKMMIDLGPEDEEGNMDEDDEEEQDDDEDSDEDDDDQKHHDDDDEDEDDEDMNEMYEGEDEDGDEDNEGDEDQDQDDDGEEGHDHEEPDGDENSEDADQDGDGLPPWLQKKAAKAEWRNYAGKK